MAGKTNLSATLFAQKKLLGKTSTGVHRADNNEPIPSGLQVTTQTIFAENVPENPVRTSYLLQSASAGANATVEYVDFLLEPITGSVYDANTFDGDAGAQASGNHAYRLVLTGNYQNLSSNSRRGKDSFRNNQILHWTLGRLQLVSPGFSNSIPNPYNILIFSGSRDVDDEIPLQDELDWQVDYFSGILFVQDFDSTKIPTRAKGFIYIGKMLSGSLGEVSAGGGGSGTGVGWIGSAPGTISSTGSVLVGTSTSVPQNAEISFSSVGGAVFNEKGRASDFRVETSGKENALLIDGHHNQVKILSGGAGTSVDPTAGTDISFFVSGALDAKGGSKKGVSLFSGDVVSSGSLSVARGLSGSLTKLYDGRSYIVAGNNVTVASSSNGQITINSSGGGLPAGANTQIQFNNGGAFGASSAFTFTGTEVELNAASPKLTVRRTNNNQNSDLSFEGAGGVIGARLRFSGSSTNDLVLSTFTGVTLKERVRVGSNASDITVDVTGSLRSSLGLSGSLTKLSDGKSYLVAGSNITIASQSNGQITISAGGGGSGTVSFNGGNGQDNQMITADGSGGIVAESNITFNGSFLAVTGSILPGADKVYDLGGPSNRFANIYTGDLHLRNERGHWTIVEEAEYLTVVNNLTGKKYKMVLEPLE